MKNLTENELELLEAATTMAPQEVSDKVIVNLLGKIDILRGELARVKTYEVDGFEVMINELKAERIALLKSVRDHGLVLQGIANLMEVAGDYPHRVEEIRLFLKRDEK